MPGYSDSCPSQGNVRGSANAWRGVCTISAETAALIFKARNDSNRHKQDKLAKRLGETFGISPKAVRDIWSLRTWVHATFPYWLPTDWQHFSAKRRCVACSRTGVSSIEQACTSCRSKVIHNAMNQASAANQGEWLVDQDMIANEFNALAEQFEQSGSSRVFSVCPTFEPCCDGQFAEREMKEGLDYYAAHGTML